MSNKNSPSVRQSTDIAKKMKQWKKEFGENAEFISKDHFTFNCFDDVWTLNAEGTSGQQVKWDFYHIKDWSDELLCHICLATGALANSKAAATIKNRWKSFLKLTPLTTFTQTDVEGAWPLTPEHHRVSLKGLLLELKKLDSTLYGDACDWVQEHHVKRKEKFDPYNIETGALSEFEQQSFERELALKMKSVQAEIESDPTNPDTQLEKLTVAKGFIALRLMYALVRRPTNLRQLKWNDILAIGMTFKSESNVTQPELSILDFSDEDELQVRMWKSKNKSLFRKSVEKYALRLTTALSFELLQYRQAYRRCLQSRLESLQIDVTYEDLNVLMMRAPVIYTPALFSVEFADKSELFSAFSEKAAGFHESSKAVTSSISKAVGKLDLKSDRVPNLNVGNNRLRHTVATLAAIMGYDAAYIAELLGNSCGAVRRYVDMSDEQRANLDNKFAGQDKLIKMFSAEIDTLQADEHYTKGKRAGEPKNSQSCTSCPEVKRPLACYGCNNFTAFEDADHQGVRIDAQRQYDKRIADGDPSIILTKLAAQIKWVDITISVCNERIANRSALNA